jgi:hypothetical protein
MGRPYDYVSETVPLTTDIYARLLTEECNITIVHQTEGNATITVSPETGYVSVRYNN